MTRGRLGTGVKLAAALLLSASADAAAQRITGRVVRPAGDVVNPVPGAWVVLHRIGHDSAGPIDSTRTNAAGSYEFRYTRAEEDSALYLVSSMRGGVAYFTPPIRAGTISGEAAEIAVFDTTSARLPLRVQGRHFVIAAPSENGGDVYEILEVYELSNDTSFTAVVGASGRPVWSALVPSGAMRFRIGQGDVSEGGMSLRDGRAELFAPVAPGLKQLSFRYELPRSAFPLSLPITQDVGLLEVVIDDPGSRITGAGLRETRPVQSEGRTFKRYLAQDVHEDAVVRVELSAGDSSSNVVVPLLAALFTAAAAAALVVSLRRGRRGAAAAAAAPVAESETLVRAIAELDDDYARGGRADGDRASYEAQRGALKDRLRAVVAREHKRA